MSLRKKAWTTSFIADGCRLFSWVRWGSVWTVVFLSLGLFACAPTQYELIQVPEPEMKVYLADKPQALHPLYRRVLQEGPRNYVLNHMKAGLAAMELGDWTVAEQSLEKALLNIESVYAENENADKARSLWYEEGRKDFKGEPYERAMAYYYRGLLFLRRGDYENARASFKGGQLQDILAEDKRYQDDFALLMFLEGWASQLNGDWDMADEAYALFKKHRPDFPLPKRGDNVLLIAETGLSPIKWATGPGRSELRFNRRVELPEVSARFNLDNQFVPARQIEDVYWQATTRGGREIDKILEGKVEFKESHGERGEALTQLGVAGFMIAAQHDSEAGMVASGIVGALGLLEQGLAAGTRTNADARYWSNLPDRVHVLTLQAPPQPFDMDTRFFDDQGIEIGDLRQTVPVEFTGNFSGLGWVRSRSAQLN